MVESKYTNQSTGLMRMSTYLLKTNTTKHYRLKAGKLRNVCEIN